jgi:hypothetical protein
MTVRDPQVRKALLRKERIYLGQTEQDAFRIAVDRALASKATGHLVSNEFEAMSTWGTVDLDLAGYTEPDRLCSMAVTDTGGPGVADNSLAPITGYLNLCLRDEGG